MPFLTGQNIKNKSLDAGVEIADGTVTEVLLDTALAAKVNASSTITAEEVRNDSATITSDGTGWAVSGDIYAPGSTVTATFVGNVTGTASGNLTSASTLDASKLSGALPAAMYATVPDVTAYNIAMWGDSLTYQQQVHLPATLTNRVVHVHGVGGETSTQIKARMLAATDEHDYLTILWAGRNNYADAATVKADIAEMVAALGHSNYVVMSILNGAGGGIGTEAYNQITGLNNDLATLYAGNWLDIRAILVAAYDPLQPQDVLDHADDIPPTSLRSDFLHLNDDGEQVVSDAILAYLAANLDVPASDAPVSSVELAGLWKAPLPEAILSTNIPRLNATTTTFAGTLAATTLDAGTGGVTTPAVTVDTDGAIGIGTAAPGADMDIYHNVSGETTISTIRLSSRASTNGQTVGALEYYNPHESAANISASIKALRGLDNVYAGALTFSTASTANALTERVRINEAGKVGIGTTAPTQTLTVHDATPTTGATGVYIKAGANQAGSATSLLAITDSGGTAYFQVGATGGVFANTIAPNSGSAGGRLTLAATGPTLIRTTEDANPGMVIQQGGAAATGDILQLKNSGGTVASVSQAGTITAPALKLTTGAGAGKVPVSDADGDLTLTALADLDFSGLPVYADNAAALAGGLAVGKAYRTATGVLMVAYTP
jgi:hypothetical protein